MPTPSTNIPLLNVTTLTPHGHGAEAGSGTTYTVRDLNDAFRRDLGRGRLVMDACVAALPADACAELLLAVRGFDAFDPSNDPHEEHDFGKVEINGEAYFWKIDYYDVDLRFGSPDPADPAVTARVMTIMRRDEY